MENYLRQRYALVGLCLGLGGCSGAEPADRPARAEATLQAPEPSLDVPSAESAADAVAQPESEAPAEPVARVGMSFSPGDLMTSVRHSAPSLTVTLPTIDPQLRQRLLAATRVVTWPEGEPVACPHSFIEADLGAGEMTSTLRYAADGLTQRWYAVELDSSLLPEFAMSDDAYSVNGSFFVARFYPGSWPTVRRTHVVEDDAGTVIRMELSERVRASSSAQLASVRSAGRAVGCEPDDLDALTSVDGSQVLILRCPRGLRDTFLEIEVGRGLANLDGQALRAPRGGGALRISLRPERARRVEREFIYIPEEPDAI